MPFIFAFFTLETHIIWSFFSSHSSYPFFSLFLIHLFISVSISTSSSTDASSIFGPLLQFLNNFIAITSHILVCQISVYFQAACAFIFCHQKVLFLSSLWAPLNLFIHPTYNLPIILVHLSPLFSSFLSNYRPHCTNVSFKHQHSETHSCRSCCEHLCLFLHLHTYPLDSHAWQENWYRQNADQIILCDGQAFV